MLLGGDTLALPTLRGERYSVCYPVYFSVYARYWCKSTHTQ
jgi:hypothetical protein